MATNKRVFTLRLSDEVFDKIGVLATKEHRSITNYIEYVLLKHLEEVEREQGEINLDDHGRLLRLRRLCYAIFGGRVPCSTKSSKPVMAPSLP